MKRKGRFTLPGESNFLDEIKLYVIVMGQNLMMK